MGKKCALLLAVLILMLFCGTVTAETTLEKYERAIDYLNIEEFSMAEKLFSKLDDYQESKKFKQYASSRGAEERSAFVKALEGYRKLGDFQDCEMRVKFMEKGMLYGMRKSGKYGFVNAVGDWIIEPQWDFVYEFEANPASDDYYARVFIGTMEKDMNKTGYQTPEDGKWGLINTRGEIVIDIEWDSILRKISDGILRTRKDGKMYMFDLTSGDAKRVSGEWDSIYTPNQQTVLVKNNGLFSYVNTNGEKLFEGKTWLDANPFSEGMALVQNGGLYGFINLKGEEVIPPQFEEGGSFYGGLAAAKQDGLWGYIDQTGAWKIEAEYEDLKDFSFGYAAVSKGNKWGFINTLGKIISKMQWESVDDFAPCGVAVVCKNGKYGAINTNGSKVVDLKYQSLDAVGEDVLFYQGPSVGFLSSTGKKVYDGKPKSGQGRTYAYCVLTSPVRGIFRQYLFGKLELRDLNGKIIISE